MNRVDWQAIRATDWQGKMSQKMAEFLIADFFPWSGFHAVGCHDVEVAKQVLDLLKPSHHAPAVTVEPGWYY